MKFFPLLSFEELVVLIPSSVLRYKGFKDHPNSSPPRGLLTLYIPFQLILALHLLIIQVTSRVLVPSAAFPNLLWVTATKVALFGGHFLINAARTLVVGI